MSQTNGLGHLHQVDMRVRVIYVLPQKRTDLTKPGMKSGEGLISLPSEARAFRMSKQAAMPETASHALLSPRARPGHMLSPPNVSTQRIIPGV